VYKVCVVIRKLGHFLLELGLNKKKREEKRQHEAAAPVSPAGPCSAAPTRSCC
jgi:hypothetical protein